MSNLANMFYLIAGTEFTIKQKDATPIAQKTSETLDRVLSLLTTAELDGEIETVLGFLDIAIEESFTYLQDVLENQSGISEEELIPLEKLIAEAREKIKKE